MSDATIFYGACGVDWCEDCLPLFNADNVQITDDYGNDLLTTDIREREREAFNALLALEDELESNDNQPDTKGA